MKEEASSLTCISTTTIEVKREPSSPPIDLISTTRLDPPNMDGEGGRGFGNLCYTSRSGRRALDSVLC